MNKEKNKPEADYSGYALAEAAYASGYRGKVFKAPSSLPPSLELTITSNFTEWPRKK